MKGGLAIKQSTRWALQKRKCSLSNSKSKTIQMKTERDNYLQYKNGSKTTYLQNFPLRVRGWKI